MKMFVVPEGTAAVVVNRSDYRGLTAIKTKNRLETTNTILDPVSYLNGRRVTFGDDSFNSTVNEFGMCGYYVFADEVNHTDWFLIVHSNLVETY